MAYDPVTDTSLPQLPGSTGQSQIEQTVAVKKIKQISFLEKRVFRGLLLFSLVIVVIASLVVGVLFLNLNVENQANNLLDDSNSQQEDSNNQENESNDDVDTTDTDDKSENSTEGWTNLSFYDGRLSFLLPPSKPPHTSGEGGVTWSWQFKQQQDNMAYIGYFPFQVSSVSCDLSCIRDHSIVIWSEEFTGSLEDYLAQVQNQFELLTPEPIEMWGTQVYQLSNDTTIAVVDGYAYMIEGRINAEYSRAVEDSEQVLSSISIR